MWRHPPPRLSRRLEATKVFLDFRVKVKTYPGRKAKSTRAVLVELRVGSTAICPEEPEFWTRAGYSEAFKQEWLARYGAPWEPPHSSIDARWKSEQLKGFLERRQIEAILTNAQGKSPQATRMVAVHSPVTYYQWGLPVPHYGLLTAWGGCGYTGGTGRTSACHPCPSCPSGVSPTSARSTGQITASLDSR